MTTRFDSHRHILASQLPEEGRHELSHGRTIECAPAGGQHGGSNLVGALPLATDPAVTEAGVDVGYELAPDIVRAPDIAIGNVPSRPGWVKGTPPLAVEYADRHQDEEQLREKIQQLLAAGTQHIWVVRLTGPRRVEVHRPGQPVQIVRPGQTLSAPGILQNAMAIETLYDPDTAREVALNNLLQREGYINLGAVQAESRAEGRAEGQSAALLRVCAGRRLMLSPEQTARVQSCTDLATLDRWIDRAVTAASADEIFAG